MGVIDFVSGTVNTVLNGVWRFKAWVEPHLWVVGSTVLVVSIPLTLAGEIDKNRLMAHSGRLRDRLVSEKKETASADLEGKLISLNTGSSGKDEEEF